jgi:phage gpG-like protein
MAGITSKKFNWVQRPTTWEYAQAWRNQRAQMAAKFLEQGQTAASAFASAQYNNTTGLVANAQQAAIDRLKAAQKKA